MTTSTIIEGLPTPPAGTRFGIVASRFNGLVTDALVAGALRTFARYGVGEDRVTVVRVPGVWELPLAARWLIEAQPLDALVALACVIRGATAHFDQIVGGATSALRNLTETAHVPIAHGIVATDDAEDALSRAGMKHGNKGEEAVLAALEMASLRARLKSL